MINLFQERDALYVLPIAAILMSEFLLYCENMLLYKTFYRIHKT